MAEVSWDRKARKPLSRLTRLSTLAVVCTNMVCTGHLGSQTHAAPRAQVLGCLVCVLGSCTP